MVTTRTRSPLLQLIEATPDQLVAIHSVSWEQYEVISEAVGDSGSPRLTYLEGELNIMSPGRAHEYLKKLLARLIEGFAAVRGISLNAFGSETLRLRKKSAGCEPDECYSVGHTGKIPDLAIECIIASGSIDKLEAYARLGCREVWFWQDGKLQVHVRLEDGTFQRRRASKVLRGFPFAEVERILLTADPGLQTETVEEFRRSLG